MEDERKIQEEIDRMFECADLSEDDRGLWRGRLETAGEFVRMSFLRSFGDDPDMLRFFTRDMRKRLDAGADRTKLDAVLAEEGSYLAAALRTADGK